MFGLFSFIAYQAYFVLPMHLFWSEHPTGLVRPEVIVYVDALAHDQKGRLQVL